jgi:5-formyltetrahydrofolate cyclo-ligase
MKAVCASKNWAMPPLIGLSLSTQIIPEVPVELHDQLLDLIVTADADFGKLALNAQN